MSSFTNTHELVTRIALNQNLSTESSLEQNPRRDQAIIEILRPEYESDTDAETERGAGKGGENVRNGQQ